MLFRAFFIALLMAPLQGSEDELCPDHCSLEGETCPSKCPDLLPCPRPRCPKPQCPVPKCPVPVCPGHAGRVCEYPECPLCPRSPGERCPPCPAATESREASESRGSDESSGEEAGLPPAPTCAPCPAAQGSYKSFGTIGSYRLYQEKATWKKANESCFRDGAHLAVPKSQIELDVMLLLLQHEAKGNQAVYIGFHDFNNEGQFVTVQGQPLSSFQESLWKESFPKNGSFRNSVVLGKDGRIWNFYDVSKETYLCQMPTF